MLQMAADVETGRGFWRSWLDIQATQTRGPHFLHAQAIALHTSARKADFVQHRCRAHYQIAFSNHTLQAIRAKNAAYVSIVSE